MDVKEFQNTRQNMLDEFNKDYAEFKRFYSQTLLAAIQETDPAKQDELIRQVLVANSAMTELIREMLTNMNKSQDGFDPKTLDELTNDLVQYQKQYQDIQQNKDRYNTLKLIYGENKQRLDSATTMFYVYLIALVLLCIVIVFLIIRAGWMQSLYQSTVALVRPGQVIT